MAFKPGYLGKVTIGANSVVGMGNWSIDGMTVEALEDTEFGDNYKTFVGGIASGGTVSCSGTFDPADTTGALTLQENMDSRTTTDLRLYIDSTSYYTPCGTAGWINPGTTTGANTPVSSALITSCTVNMDKEGLAEFSFTAQVSGLMVLV